MTEQLVFHVTVHVYVILKKSSTFKDHFNLQQKKREEKIII